MCSYIKLSLKIKNQLSLTKGFLMFSGVEAATRGVLYKKEL